MGLFDWLTEGIGSSMGGSSMPDMGPSGAPPMGGDPMTAGGDMPNGPGLPGRDVPPLLPRDPPLTFQRPEFAQGRSMPPLPPGGDAMAAGGDVSNGPGLPPPPIPMPAARPAGAPGPLPPLPPTATGPSAFPPGSTPTGGGPGMPPGSPPTSLSPAQAGDAYSAYRAVGGGGPVSIYGSNGSVPGGSSAIGRALGLDANKERSLLGGLGAAMTAAGNSAGKTKGQAFFSGVGAGLQGSEKTEDKGFDQRLKSLQLANKALESGDTATYHKEIIKAKMAELQQEQDKFTGKGMTDSQKYLEAQRRAAADVDSRGLLIQLREHSITPEQFKAESKAIKDGHLKGLGLDPNKPPPGTPPTADSPGNPHRLPPNMSQADFDRDVKPGEAYINPKNGRGYVREGGGPTPAAEAAPTAPPTPAVAATGIDPEDTSNGV